MTAPPRPKRSALARTINRLRIQAGMTQADLAEQIGVTRQTVVSLESTEVTVRVSVPQLAKIAHALARASGLVVSDAEVLLDALTTAVHADAHAAFHAAVPDTLRKAERARNRLDAAGRPTTSATLTVPNPKETP